MDIFSKIIAKEIPADFLYEDDDLIIMADKFPKAEKHFLVIPKRRIESVAQAQAEDASLIGSMIIAAKKFALGQGFVDFKLLFNAGKYVEVPYLHLHLLCGEMNNSSEIPAPRPKS